MKKHAAPLIAALLLFLSVLYLGSYCALVKPFHRSVWVGGAGTLRMELDHYRWGGRVSAKVFWPLEQIDRTVRPEAWELICPDPGWSSYPPLDFAL
jgi:hypothetical protein